MSERNDEIRESEDYQTARRILGRLYLNIERAKEFRLPHFEHFKQMCDDFKEKWEEAKKASKILRGLKTYSFEPSSEYSSMSKMLTCLGLVESLGVALADMVLILLIANGKEVHTRRPMTKHVTKARELENIDLVYKLDFLEDEGLDLFGKFINRDVRNHIAHLKFTIRDNGEIRKRDGSPIDIDKNISGFWVGVDTLELVFEDIGLLKWFEK